MNKRTGLVLVIGFLSLIVVGSYAFYLFRLPPESIYDFLQDDPCTIPCWENIIPGESSELGALKTLIKARLIDDSANYVRDDRLQFLTQRGDEVSIFFLHEKVQQIDFNPNAQFLLSTMIDKLGKPEKIYMNIEGEHEVCHVSSLYYPEHGLRIKAGDCEDFKHASRFNNGNVMPDTPVLLLSFVEPNMDSELMLQSFDIIDTQRQEITQNLVDWNGYGYYSP
ncbi:MAG: hypothetical protein WAM60_19515 [Candidatus Promineifilaceae bacterium]